MGRPKQVCCIFFQRPERNIGGAYMGRPSQEIFLFETFFMTYRWHWWVILVNFKGNLDDVRKKHYLLY